MIRTLLIDDESALLDIGSIYLKRTGDIAPDTAGSACDALRLLAAGSYDVIVSDYEMPGMNGIDLLKHLRSGGNTTPFILFTGRGREDIVIEALNNGATFYLQKGTDITSQYAELIHKIRQAVRQFRAERSVHESQRLMEQLLNSLPDPTIAMNPDGKLIMWNRATEEMTGVPASEVLGKGDLEYSIPFFGKKQPLLADLLRNPDGTTPGHHWQIRKREQNLIIGECLAALPDGRRLSLWGKATLLYDAEGKVSGAIESIRDITLRKRIIDERKNARELLARKIAELSSRNEQLAATEEELRQTFEELQQGHLLLQDSERNYRVLVESVPDALIVHDNGTIIFANPAASRLFRPEPAGDLTGTSLFSFFDDEQARDIGAQSRDVLSGGIVPSPREYRIGGPGCRTPIVEAAFSQVRYQDKKGVQILFRDISEQKTLERHIRSQNEELRQSTTALERVNRKIHLLNSVTRHDVLNQVQVLQGYIDLAKGQTTDEVLRGFLDRQDRAVRSIHRQILFTRDYQELGIRPPEWQDIPTLVSRSIDQVGSSRIKFTVHVDRLEILADCLLEKIFSNLIDNSIRHGEPVNEIRIHVKDSGNGLILIYEDNGVGIPAGDKKKIFDRGFGKNTGLGLFLTREILSITGINITENGEPGCGARFEIEVPPGKYKIAGGP